MLAVTHVSDVPCYPSDSALTGLGAARRPSLGATVTPFAAVRPRSLRRPVTPLAALGLRSLGASVTSLAALRHPFAGATVTHVPGLTCHPCIRSVPIHFLLLNSSPFPTPTSPPSNPTFHFSFLLFFLSPLTTFSLSLSHPLSSPLHLWSQFPDPSTQSLGERGRETGTPSVSGFGARPTGGARTATSEACALFACRVACLTRCLLRCLSDKALR